MRSYAPLAHFRRSHRLFIGLALASLSILVLAGCGTPQQEPTEVAQEPPLLDRELFFGNPAIANAQVSPDGEFVSFMKEYDDVRNVWIKGRDEAFDAARPLTADERPVPGYFWSQDGRFLLYVQDKGGNEDFHIYAVDPRARPEEGSEVPPARDLTPIEGVRAVIYNLPENDPEHALIGLNDRDPRFHDVYRLHLDTGDRELLIQNDTGVAAWVADLEGRVRLAVRQTADGGTEVLRVRDDQVGDALYTCNYRETCGPVRFHSNGEQVYFQSNHGEDVDLIRLYLMDAETGDTTLVEKDPQDEVDFGGATFYDATEELMATFYVGDRVRIYPQTETAEEALETLREQLPDGELGLQSQTSDGRYWIVSVDSDVDPGSVYLYDHQAGATELLYRSRPELPSEHLAPMEPLRYSARDGLEIPAYLTLPKGKEAKNLPVVVFPHGGPWARDTWGYNPFAQFLANRGYAVFQPNFRGSTGYGKEFLNAGNDEWGTGAMQHDITDGVRHLIDRGIADPEKVGIMGGSYGGYATLAGLAFTPDLYAAGVSIVGPSNLITLLNSIPPYWGPIQKMFHQRLGDPEDPEDRERLIEQSPLFAATQIKAPLLVIQGANDPRVKQAESDQIVEAMHELGRQVRYLVAPDEGHGFRSETNRLAMTVAYEEFLADHLGGRHQPEVDPETASHLEGLWVDPASVEVEDPVEVTPRG